MVRPRVPEPLPLPGRRQLLLPLLIPVEILYIFWRKSSYRVQDRGPESGKIVGSRIEGSNFFYFETGSYRQFTFYIDGVLPPCNFLHAAHAFPETSFACCSPSHPQPRFSLSATFRSHRQFQSSHTGTFQFEHMVQMEAKHTSSCQAF